MRREVTTENLSFKWLTTKERLAWPLVGGWESVQMLVAEACTRRDLRLKVNPNWDLMLPDAADP